MTIARLCRAQIRGLAANTIGEPCSPLLYKTLFNEDTVTALSNFLDFPSWRCFMLSSKTIYGFCKSSKVKRSSIEVCVCKDCPFSRAHVQKTFPKYTKTPEEIDDFLKYDVRWLGKYTNGYSWCRGTIVLINKEIGQCLYLNDEDTDKLGHFESPREIIGILKNKRVNDLFSESHGPLVSMEDVLALKDPNDYAKIITELEYVEKVGKSRGIEFTWI